MNKLKDFFKTELPKVNRALEEELAALDPLVREVGEHVLLAGGKRLRPMLTILTARGLGKLDKEVYPLACSLELLHSATLIHDDILDNADVRRGRDSAHRVFGIKRTVLAGDALLALANMIVARYDAPAMNYSLAEAVLKTASGEIREIDNIRNSNLDQQSYLEIITGKTAFLIQAACSCGALLAKAHRDLIVHAEMFGLNLGIAFQLIDDALDYAPDAGLLGKPLGSDIREGKITLPLIFYLESLSEGSRRELLDGISRNRLDEDQIQKVIKSIQNTGLDQKVRHEAEFYLGEARKSLQIFPESQEKQIMEEMLEMIKIRVH